VGQDQELTKRISALAALPDHEVGLAEGALVIAKFEYPDLDVSSYLGLLDAMGARLKARIEGSATPDVRVEEMNRFFFQEEGFRGNLNDYYDRRNSFLNEVLDRKLGIPITISIAYIEVGRRAGLPLYGIGFPGHFLTGLLADKGRMFIDPFNNGKILSENDCRRMVRGRPGGSQPFNQSLLDPAWPKQILARLLRNLKGVYWHRAEPMKAFQMIEWILALEPNSPLEVKERGFIYEAIGDVRAAVKDLARYLDLAPDAEDADFVRTAIDRLKATKPTIH